MCLSLESLFLAICLSLSQITGKIFDPLIFLTVVENFSWYCIICIEPCEWSMVGIWPWLDLKIIVYYSCWWYNDGNIFALDKHHIVYSRGDYTIWNLALGFQQPGDKEAIYTQDLSPGLRLNVSSCHFLTLAMSCN